MRKGDKVPEEANAVAPEKPAYVEATLSILGYQEEEEWIALALEMDLRGYGQTWEEALGDLRDLVVMQVGFAHSKGEPGMIWRSAEEKYWELYREAQRAHFLQAVTTDLPQSQTQLHAGGLAIPPAHVIAATRTSTDARNPTR